MRAAWRGVHPQLFTVRAVDNFPLWDFPPSREVRIIRQETNPLRFCQGN